MKITDHLKEALMDWRTLVHHLITNATPVQLLVREYPKYTHYNDARKVGAGGFITQGTTPVPYWV